MKSFLKILFVLLAIFQANVSEAKVFLFAEATVLHTFNLEKSSAELQSVILENDIANTCKSESDLVAYKNWYISYNAVAAKGVTQLSTRFVSTSKGVADLQPTLNRIASGGKFPHRNDGSIFKNFEGLLPKQNAGFYREFFHPTSGITGPGPMRIVTGQNGGMWFTPDHYKTFIPIR